MSALFADGGVILKNPSPYGGTYAWRIVGMGKAIKEGGGYISADDAKTFSGGNIPTVSNNLTEMLAVVRGLENVPDDWHGFINSDSQVTLGRIFMQWKWNNIPEWLHEDFRVQVKRLKNWDKIRYQLLSGHPTHEMLFAGIGKHNLPVSEHNVWCDKECGRQADLFMLKLVNE